MCDGLACRGWNPVVTPTPDNIYIIIPRGIRVTQNVSHQSCDFIKGWHIDDFSRWHRWPRWHEASLTIDRMVEIAIFRHFMRLYLLLLLHLTVKHWLRPLLEGQTQGSLCLFLMREGLSLSEDTPPTWWGRGHSDQAGGCRYLSHGQGREAARGELWLLDTAAGLAIAAVAVHTPAPPRAVDQAGTRVSSKGAGGWFPRLTWPWGWPAPGCRAGRASWRSPMSAPGGSSGPRNISRGGDTPLCSRTLSPSQRGYLHTIN